MIKASSFAALQIKLRTIKRKSDLCPAGPIMSAKHPNREEIILHSALSCLLVLLLPSPALQYKNNAVLLFPIYMYHQENANFF